MTRGWWTRVGAIAVPMVLALIWRLYLRRVYYGWEESDYGNLAMIRGVLDGGFLHYDMNHMPGYYGLSAMLLAVVGDTVVAARTVTLTGGMVAMLLSLLLVQRLSGSLAALITGLLLAFQPEFSLYSSSSLREPIYACFILSMLYNLSRERTGWAGIFAAAAFLVRFDGMFIFTPLLLFHSLSSGPRLQRAVRALVPMVVVILLWSTYTWIDHDTPFFWSHSIGVNVETGLGDEAETTGQWLLSGVSVSAGLVADLLPSRIGWGPWIGLFVVLGTAPWRRHGLERTWVVLGLLMLSFWAAVGFIGQHSPDHNLYWKWLCPIIPVIVPLGVTGLLRLTRWIGAVPGTVLVGIALVASLVGGLKETRRQIDLSVQLYKPQLDLALWVEAEVPEDVPMLLDNIPACWIDRRHHGRTLHTWFDVPGEGDPAAFAAWLRAERVGWVLWFVEDWTQAPVVAPFLAAGGRWQGEGVELVETRREDGYGWILYRVQLLDEPPVDG